ncbi:MAG: hypothetical protein NZL90_01640 [Aquificaceae bacterium]|nr:hypothetical protein [Aquificaceae bacterium]
MSLSSFIELEDVKHEFKRVFLVEKAPKVRGLDINLLAKPKTENFSLVGTAFDYLLRFHIKKHYKNAIETKWVAEALLQLLENKEFDIYLPDTQVEKMREIVSRAKMEYKKYLSGGSLTDDLIISCVLLARMDNVYRALKDLDFFSENCRRE